MISWGVPMSIFIFGFGQEYSNTTISSFNNIDFAFKNIIKEMS